MLVLSGDISVNTGPVYNSQSSCSNEWNVFKAKGIHLIHLNVNSLLPKIDEIQYITVHTNAAVIGISESKLDETISQSGIQMSTNELLRCDKNTAFKICQRKSIFSLMCVGKLLLRQNCLSNIYVKSKKLM